MIRTIVDVAAGEGVKSATVRAAERLDESWRRGLERARGLFAQHPRPPIVNVACTPLLTRRGGVAVQLKWRFDAEQNLRETALFDRGILHAGGRAWRAESLEALTPRAVILEGGFEEVPDLPASAAVVAVVHDFTLMSARALLEKARAVVFPSAFLRDAYGVEGRIIEPGIPNAAAPANPLRNRVAFAGSVKEHKGGALIPEIVRATREAEWHVFGGGDRDWMRAIRATRRASVHGYYRAGSLPALLARHRIGLAIMPSIVPETFSLTLSECWAAGVPVVAFDHGAVANRIRAHGGGFLVSPDSGAGGIAEVVNAWLRGVESVSVPITIPTALNAASEHVALYRELGFL